MTVTIDEIDVAHQGAAVLSNKFYVSVDGNGIRLAFCEQHQAGIANGKPPKFRTAVFLSVQDGIGLAGLIQELIAERENKIKEQP